ncbi:hypothetical protein BpHYR1_014642 [Brachionus plicatilis]|uniref:Uncharacterized protein n=1 Tax=Brachionus plicatilis TaxID=10195 RepID=A0A3M7QYG0_BRAPC|nr:hypothetical protein BpHYR1_014642 [Brachionus plicatilis]
MKKQATCSCHIDNKIKKLISFLRKFDLFLKSNSSKLSLNKGCCLYCSMKAPRFINFSYCFNVANISPFTLCVVLRYRDFFERKHWIEAGPHGIN